MGFANTLRRLIHLPSVLCLSEPPPPPPPRRRVLADHVAAMRVEQMAALVCIRALGLQLTTDGTDQRMQIDPTSQTPDRAAIVT